jgi:hypothetical protein
VRDYSDRQMPRRAAVIVTDGEGAPGPGPRRPARGRAAPGPPAPPGAGAWSDIGRGRGPAAAAGPCHDQARSVTERTVDLFGLAVPCTVTGDSAWASHGHWHGDSESVTRTVPARAAQTGGPGHCRQASESE